MRSTANHNCIAQLSLAGLAWVAALSLLPFSASADAYSDGQPLLVSQSDITIYDAPYVLEHFTHYEGDELIFTDRSGRNWALLEDPSSPAISNKGDGSYHPFDPRDVAAACEAVSYPLGRIPVEVFVLPYPRADLLDCSSERGTVYLSPGMQEIPQEHAHLIVTHEVGHCVHRALMPDSDTQAWNRYKELRGIADASVYSDAAVHCRRPHEIFAEDFRWLFGGSLSKYSGTIENPELTLPSKVPGLEEFMLSLAEMHLACHDRPASPIKLEVTSYPNPFSKRTTVSLKIERGFAANGYSSGSLAAQATVFDASGRMVKELGRHELGSRPLLQFNWDGTDNYGHHLSSGVYFLRVDVSPVGGHSVHKMLLKR